MNSKRKNTRKYYYDDKEICKTAFLTTLQINQRKVDIALRKSEGAKIEDLRGIKSGGLIKLPHLQVGKFPNCKKLLITSVPFLDTYPTIEDTPLNLPKIYSLYQTSMAGDETRTVSLSSFKTIFYSKFNLRFIKPKKDTCLKCDKYKAQIEGLTGGAVEQLKVEHADHLEQAKKLRS